MSEDSKKQDAQDDRPVELVDAALAHLATLIQSLEEKRELEAEQAQIPADIPRFVTYR